MVSGIYHRLFIKISIQFEIHNCVPSPCFPPPDGVVIATKDSTADPSRIRLVVGDLVFDHTVTSDTNTYMCIADNGVGVANATVSLGVYGELGRCRWMSYVV